MKNFLFRSALILFNILVLATVVFCQDAGIEPGDFTIPLDPNALYSDVNVNLLYGAIVVIGGYLSAYIPGIKNIGPGVYRVLVWALLTGLGLYLWGASVLSLALTYFIATGLYSVVLKFFLRSPTPTKTVNGIKVKLNTAVKPVINELLEG